MVDLECHQAQYRGPRLPRRPRNSRSRVRRGILCQCSSGRSARPRAALGDALTILLPAMLLLAANNHVWSLQKSLYCAGQTASLSLNAAQRPEQSSAWSYFLTALQGSRLTVLKEKGRDPCTSDSNVTVY
jgi:hypothetical protein